MWECVWMRESRIDVGGGWTVVVVVVGAPAAPAVAVAVVVDGPAGVGVMSIDDMVAQEERWRMDGG
jgi:hypothetical protein